MRTEMELERVIESHHLHPQHPIFKVSDDKEFLCELCQTSSNPYSSSSSSSSSTSRTYRYTCEHCGFNLHAFCATHPPAVRSPLHHHDHTLVFVPGYKCGLCNDSLRSGVLDYGCDACDYYIHPACHHQKTPTELLHLPEQITHQGNKRLVLSEKAAASSFICDRCGDAGSGRRYTSRTIRGVHTYCGVPLPQKLRTYFHPQHELLLGSWHKEHRCDYCGDAVRGAFYACKSKEGCSFVIHPVCHERSLGVDQTPAAPVDHGWPQDHWPTLRRSSVPHVCYEQERTLTPTPRVEPVGSDRDERGSAGEMYFFMHPEHELTAMNFGGGRPARSGAALCEVCGREPMGDCLSCLACEFHVHRACFWAAKPTLVDKVHSKHVLHYLKAGQEQCNMCDEMCSFRSWRYYCAICDQHFHKECLHSSPLPV